MRILTLIFIFFALAMAHGAPTQIILLRHAEKPDDPADPSLSPKGRERAEALVSLLGPKDAPLTRKAPIAALYATRITKNGRSLRTRETLAPLAKKLGINVNTPYKSEEVEDLARDVLANATYEGKTVVICWTHQEIADLAGAFGVNPKPDKWKDKRFDKFWILDFRGGTVKFRESAQRLLPGDAKR